MYFEPYNNFAVDLSKVPMITLEKTDRIENNAAIYKLTFGIKSGISVYFSESKVLELMQAIEQMNAPQAPKKMLWLKPDQCINLDQVVSLTLMDSKLFVQFPAEMWESHISPRSPELFRELQSAMQQRNRAKKAPVLSLVPKPR